MCYDGSTLSAYLDGELKDIESSEIKYHLSTCNKCSEKINRFESLSKQLKKSKLSGNSLITDTIWTRVVHATAAGRDLDFWHRGFVLAPSFLLSVSFLFLSVIGFGLFYILSGNSNNNIIVADNSNGFASENFPVNIPVDSIETVLSYLNIHDDAMEVSIQLPDPSIFAIQGEPRFLKKIDYVADR